MRMPGTIRPILVMVSLIGLLAGESFGIAGERKKTEPARDFLGDALPPGAIARLGTMRLWHKGTTSVRFSADSKELATVGAAWNSQGSPMSAIRWWDAATGRSLREQHFPGHVFSWAALPDGKRLALGVVDEKGSRIGLWDLARDKEIDGSLMEHQAEIFCIAALADGNSLVCRDESDSSFWIWDLTKRKKIKTLSPLVARDKDYTTYASALSRDGRRSAWYFVTEEKAPKDKPSGERDGEFIQVVEDGTKKVYECKDHFAQGLVLALSPNGKWLAWATSEQFPRIVNLDNKSSTTPFPSQKDLGRSPEIEYTSCLTFSPDNKILACAMTQMDGNFLVKLWNLEQKRSVTLSAAFPDLSPRCPERYLVFSEDSRTVAISDGNRVRLYDTATGKERVRIPAGHHLSIRNLFFSSDGTSLISDDGKMVCRWPREAKRVPGFRGIPQIRREIDPFDPMRKQLPFGLENAITSFDLTRALNADYEAFDISAPSPRKVCRLKVDKARPYSTNNFSPDNQRVLLNRDEGKDRHTIAYEIWDAVNGKRIGSWPCSGSLQSRFSPDSHFFAWQDWKEGRIIVGDLRSGKLMRTLSTDLSRKPQRQWPIQAGSNIPVSDPNFLRWHFGSLAFSPDDQRMAAVWNSTLADYALPGQLIGKQDKEPTTLYVWNIASGKERARIAFQTPKGKMPQITCLAFLRDGRTLAAGYLNDASVHLIEVASGRERAVLHGHQGTVRSLALSPEGRYLLSGSDDTTILVWDMDQLPSASSGTDETPLSAKRCTQLWEDLASSDAAVAFRAIEILRRHPDEAMTLLHERLQPIAEVEPGRIQQWIQDLDSSDFAVRERGSRELERLAELAEPALRKALAKPPSLEMRLRLQRVLETVASLTLSPERLRQVRGVEVLEAIGSRAAREYLRNLAGGADAARLTCEARESLQRLAAAP